MDAPERDASEDQAGPEHHVDDSTLIASRPRRRFTLAEARRALPLVSRIAADVSGAYAEARDAHARLSDASTRERRRELEADLDRVVNRLQVYLDELADIGVELKDYSAGLLDFVAVHEGREVFLCWKLGEQTIEHWHEVDAGFAGRQPVEALVQSEI